MEAVRNVIEKRSNVRMDGLSLELRKKAAVNVVVLIRENVIFRRHDEGIRRGNILRLVGIFV